MTQQASELLQKGPLTLRGRTRRAGSLMESLDATVDEAAADEEGAYGGFGQEACGNIVWEGGARGYAVHFSNLVGADGIDFFSDKWRKGQQVMQKSGTK